MRGNVGGTFLGGAIDVDGNVLAVPVQLLRNAGVVDGGPVDAERLASLRRIVELLPALAQWLGSAN